MPVKYQCPKCRRRFAEWGAEKLGFKCPQDELCPSGAGDESIELVRMGSSDEKTSRKPAVRRLSRRAVPGVPAAEEGEDEFADTTTEKFSPVAVDDDAGDDDDDDDEVVEPDVVETFAADAADTTDDSEDVALGDADADTDTAADTDDEEI
jgi:hypothetical protein